MTALLTEHLATWIAADTTEKSARGRSAAASLYGVKKLRELILELAVRGLLVPQNPDDEPASELLKKIAAEKAQLVKEGKIKAQKPLPPIGGDEKPFELPKGWEWTCLGNLSTNIHYGYTASANHIDKDGIRLLRITDIQNDSVDWVSVPVCEITEAKASDFILENNDILIARTGGTIGKSYLVQNINLKSVFASYLIRVKRIDGIHTPFIKVYLGSQLYWQQLYANSMGTGQPNVNATALKSLVLAIPPLAEQQRIVTKVDELMALCDQLEQQQNNSQTAHQHLVSQLLNALTQAANANDFQHTWQRIVSHFDVLFTTEDSINQLKQSILQLAVMGKLVPQNPNDEPASQLLKKIAAEKAKLVKEGKIKAQKPLPPIGDNEKPFDLPNGWEWVRLGDVIKVSSGNGLTSEQMDKTGKVPVYGGNGINGYHTEANINVRTLVIGRVGFYCGSIHITPELAWVTDNAFITSFSEKNIYLEFLYWLLRITNLKENEGATAQPVISGAKIYPIVVALPPLAEQQRIVTKVDELMALCDQLKNQLNQAKHLQGKIADVLVEQALG